MFTTKSSKKILSSSISMTFPGDVQFVNITDKKIGKIAIDHLKVDAQRSSNSFCCSSRKKKKVCT